MMRHPTQQTIELDCPPGYPRPGDLINDVIEGTGLVVGESVSRVFGNWTWVFEMPRVEWELEVQPIIRPRIEALYNAGVIRYGSW
jgi:hypothetical protein